MYGIKMNLMLNRVQNISANDYEKEYNDFLENWIVGTTTHQLNYAK